MGVGVTVIEPCSKGALTQEPKCIETCFKTFRKEGVATGDFSKTNTNFALQMHISSVPPKKKKKKLPTLTVGVVNKHESDYLNKMETAPTDKIVC